MIMHPRIFILHIVGVVASHAATFSEPWQRGYAGPDAGGAHVLGFWKFDPGAESADSSGHGHDLKLFENAVSGDGRFGGALESHAGFPRADVPHGARVTRGGGLSPAGAFTLELWLRPKRELLERGRGMLLDKKYVSHNDYQWQIHVDGKSGIAHGEVSLGFGDHSRNVVSQSFMLEPDQWHHLAFTYDGSGQARFFLDGKLIGDPLLAGEGRVVAGSHPLCIGERVGSNYPGCPAWLDEVRVCNGALEFRRGATRIESERFVFERMERSPEVTIRVRSFQREPMRGAGLALRFGDAPPEELAIPEIAAGGEHVVKHRLDSALKPDTYELNAALHFKDGYATADRALFRIVPRIPPRMPVVMWGIGGGPDVFDEMKRAREIGFTHFIGLGADYDAVWRVGKPVAKEESDRLALERRMLDEALAAGMRVSASVSPESWLLKSHPEFAQVDRNGKTYARTSIIGTDPRLEAFWRNLGGSVAETYGAFPAFDSALVDTEVRDSSQISFSARELEEVKKATGAAVPPEVLLRSGVDHAKLKNFPTDRVVADDDPILRFYRWWWRNGDGWNALHSAFHAGLHDSGRKDLWTWFDPAVRAPSISGSGGGVDVLSHWTYTYPDPIKIGLCADELFAMARANGLNQRVMKMTQLIWYRSQTAPMSWEHAEAGAKLAAWEDHDPGAAYITIAPMHLREALWTKLARPVSGIMYHGWQSLVPTTSAGAYRYTHPDTQHELARLVREVVRPFGPMLLQVPDAGNDVAFLQSFTSEMFTRKAMHGGGTGWAADAWLITQYAHLQSDIVFDESISKNGLDGYKALVMADCDVLPRSVVEKVKSWQARGGIIIADEFLCPALGADIVLRSYKRAKKADVDKAQLLERAGELRSALDGRYARAVDTSSQEIIPRLRRYRSTDYVFIVSDRREFGDYVGQHGLVMENGLVSEGFTMIRRPSDQCHVYDLAARRKIACGHDEKTGMMSFHAAGSAAGLEPCGGKIFMVTDRAIESVEVGPAQPEVRRGESLEIRIRVVDADGKPLAAVIPVHLDIRDPAGREMEWSGHHAAKDGVLSIRCDCAKNDRPGIWSVVATELAGGSVGRAYFRVK